jgi:putative nucleotidyltransferase-like protein
MAVHAVDAVPVDPPGIVARLARNALIPVDGPIVAAPLNDAAWDRVLRWVELERAVGVTMRAVAEGRFALTEAQHEGLILSEQAAVRTVLVLERLLLVAVEALTRAGIDSRVLKGPALAYTAYEDPSLRHFGDIDLLVRSQDIGRAVEALTRAGIRRSRPELNASFDRRFAKGVTMYDENAMSIDLHRTIASGWFGLRMNLDDLFASPVTFSVGDVKMQTLDRETSFLACCYNAVLGEVGPRPRVSLDIAHLARGLNLDRARKLAQRWGGEAVMARAVTWSWDLLALPKTDLSGWAASYVPVARDERAIRASLPNQSSGEEALMALRAIKGMRAKGTYVRGFLFAPRQVRRKAGAEGLVAWWARGARRMWRKRGGHGHR